MEPVIQEKIKCDICGKECNGVQGLITHKRWTHSEEGRAKMMAAARRTVEIKREKEGLRKVTCDLCNHPPFPSVQALSLHKSWVHDPRKRKERLKAARKSVVTKRRLQHAVNGTVGTNNPFQCKLCDHLPFTSESGVRYHLKAAHGIQGSGRAGAVCPECGYRSTAHGVDLHRKFRHGVIGPFSRKNVKNECPYCEFSGPSSYALAVHMKSQHPDKTGIEVMRPNVAPAGVETGALIARPVERPTMIAVLEKLLDKVTDKVADKIFQQLMEGQH